MQTVNETNVPSSKTGSGLNVITSLGQKVLSLFRGSKKSPVEEMTIDFIVDDYALESNGFYIVKNGKLYAGPYARQKDAKGQLTRLRKGYTPAARKV